MFDKKYYDKKSFIVFISFIIYCLFGYHFSLGNRLNIGPMFQFGMPMNDAIALEAITSDEYPNFSKESIDLSKKIVDKGLINVLKAHKSLGIKAAYEFGEYRNEKFSIDLELVYLWQSYHLTNVNIFNEDGLPKNFQGNLSPGQRSKLNIYGGQGQFKTKIDLGSISFFLGGKYFLFRGDTASLFIGGGLDIKLNISSTIERELGEGLVKQKTDDSDINSFVQQYFDSIKLSEEETKKIQNEISTFNIAPRACISFQFFDRVITTNFFVRYWLFEEMDIKRGKNGEFSKFLGGDLFPVASMKVNRYFDLYTAVEIDLMPIFRKNSSEEILD